MAAPNSGASGQALAAGTRLEEFVIERVLGEGGFGITYLAHDTGLGRQVVIKENLPVQFAWRDPHSLTVAPRHTSGDASDFEWSLENFSKEAAMLASLDHPGIVKVLRSFRALGTAYFVMPFVEGVAFDQLIDSRMAKGQPFSEEELRGLLTRLLDALAHLHDRGIYHRDIKPANILIGNDGIPALIDFGSARQRLSERSMTVVESAGYTPFEQLQSRGNIGPWSDLYALGATLYKAITYESPPKAADRIGAGPMVPLASRNTLSGRYSVIFLNSIDRALAVNAVERWQNAKEWLVGMNISARPLRNDATAPLIPPYVSTQPLGYAKTEFVEPIQLPSLYNPKVVANLDFFFTPAWGAFLIARNELVLGRSHEEKANRYWFYVMSSLILFGLVFSCSMKYLYFPGLVMHAIWYRFFCKKHIDYVRLTLGDSYIKKSFVKPLLVAFGCLIAAVIFAEGLHSLARGSFDSAETEKVSTPESSDSKDADLQYYQGVAFANGDGVEKDPFKAVHWYRKAADQGLAAAQFNLGVCYARGEGIGKNESEAVQWYGKAADQGHALAQCNLGYCYDEGRGVTKDVLKAVMWYRNSADQGNASAQCNLGICYEYGRGLAKDEAEAVKWYRKSAAQGHITAQYVLGVCYENGDGLSKDPVEAVAWYHKAAEQGDHRAQFRLGACYEYGQGVVKDLAQAVEWYKKSADQGNDEAQCNLGLYYHIGKRTASDYEMAANWFRKSADQGNPVAQYNLGNCYLNGEGVTKDYSEAVHWYRKAADQNNAEAQNRLGVRFESGQGVPKNAEEAVVWYRKSADQGNAHAQFNLGNAYYNGQGVSENISEAVNWYRKSAAQGHEQAKKNLEIALAYLKR